MLTLPQLRDHWLLDLFCAVVLLAVAVTLFLAAAESRADWLTCGLWTAIAAWDGYQYWRTRAGKHVVYGVVSGVLALGAVPLFPPLVYTVTRAGLGALALTTLVVYLAGWYLDYRDQRG